MSFGFGVGDFLAASTLAFKLYRNCIEVARGAPAEFQLLVQELSNLKTSLHVLAHEAQDPKSTIFAAGEERVNLLKGVLEQVTSHLRELESVADKYINIAQKNGGSRGRMKQMWMRIRWSVEVPEVDSLRNKLTYHNGIINLILTSCGNSSLQRIEQSHQRLVSSIDEVRAWMRPHAPSGAPVQSSTMNRDVMTMHADVIREIIQGAEEETKNLLSIGLDVLIQTGRFWFMKGRLMLELSGSDEDPQQLAQGYVDILKAAWILADLVPKHPQLNLMDFTFQHDARTFSDEVCRYIEVLKTNSHSTPQEALLKRCDTQALVKPQGPEQTESVLIDEHTHEIFTCFCKYVRVAVDIETPFPVKMRVLVNHNARVPVTRLDDLSGRLIMHTEERMLDIQGPSLYQPSKITWIEGRSAVIWPQESNFLIFDLKSDYDVMQVIETVLHLRHKPYIRWHFSRFPGLVASLAILVAVFERIKDVPLRLKCRSLEPELAPEFIFITTNGFDIPCHYPYPGKPKPLKPIEVDVRKSKAIIANIAMKVNILAAEMIPNEKRTKDLPSRAMTSSLPVIREYDDIWKSWLHAQGQFELLDFLTELEDLHDDYQAFVLRQARRVR